MKLSLRYVKAGLIWLAVGGTLLLLAFSHLLPLDLTAFYFMQLYGFVAMMIFGLSYLFVPSFAHALLHSLRLTRLQFWLMNLGAAGMTLAFSGLLTAFGFLYNPNMKYVFVACLLILVLALYIHVYNLWATMRSWKDSPGEKLAREAETRKA
jgi:cbb3-type cytochrome oxidase subunit 1